jgi:hypothetical protein
MNAQEVHARDDETLLRIPLPFSISADILGGDTWAGIRQEAIDRHLKVSVRGIRPSQYKSGNVDLTGMKQQINIMKLNPNEPIPLAETLDFYEDLMDMMEELGIRVRGNDPLIDAEHHDTAKGKVEVYMHGRLVEVTGVASSPPQVTAFTPPLVDANARVDEIYFRREPFVYTRRHEPVVLRENEGRMRRRSRSRRRRRDDATAGAEQEAQPAAPAAGHTAEGEAPASGVSSSPELKEESDSPVGGVSPTQSQIVRVAIDETQEVIQEEPPMLVDDEPEADYCTDEIERQRRYEEAVWLLSDIAQASAVTAMDHLQAPDPNFKVMVENATRSNSADEMIAGSDLKIVMCLTTYCRTEQLKAALPINLACSWGIRDKVIWVLADMNDEDESSTLLAWLDKSVAASLVSGQLSVVRRTGPWSGWHACYAKNTSHMAGIHIASTLLESRPPNVILVNCDSDNLPSKKFFTYLLGRHALMCDAQGLEWPKLPGVSFRHPGATSTTGRICLSALVFLRLGGYDQAMLPMGYQDIDLTKRLARLGEPLNVNGAEETGNVLNNVMAAVSKSQRRKEEVKAKVANVALEHKKITWGL